MDKTKELPIGYNWKEANDNIEFSVTASFNVPEHKPSVELFIKGEMMVFETKESLDEFINGLILSRDRAFSEVERGLIMNFGRVE